MSVITAARWRSSERRCQTGRRILRCRQTMQAKEKIAVVGASGYAGEELLERLLTHPGVEIVCLTSRQHAGQRLYDVYPRFRRPSRDGAERTEPIFVAPDADTIIRTGARFAFLALPHGLASEFAVPLLDAGLRVIDLSADFRLRDAAVYQDFYEHEHPAPEWLARGGVRPAGTPRPPRGHRRRATRGGSRLLSDEHPGAVGPSFARGIARPHANPGQQHERRQRRRAQGRREPPLCRVQRERQALRSAAAPAPFRDRAGTFPRRRQCR